MSLKGAIELRMNASNINKEYMYIRICIINSSSTIIPAYTTYMKTLPRSHNARANLCSIKKRIGEPAGNNISTIIIH